MAPEVFRKPAGFRKLSVKHVRAGPRWPTVQSRFQRGLPLAQDGDSSGASPKPGGLRHRADPLGPSGAAKPKPFSLKWKTRQGLGFLFSFVLFLMSVSSRGHVLVALTVFVCRILPQGQQSFSWRYPPNLSPSSSLRAAWLIVSGHGRQQKPWKPLRTFREPGPRPSTWHLPHLVLASKPTVSSSNCY